MTLVAEKFPLRAHGDRGHLGNDASFYWERRPIGVARRRHGVATPVHRPAPVVPAPQSGPATSIGRGLIFWTITSLKPLLPFSFQVSSIDGLKNNGGLDEVHLGQVRMGKVEPD